MLHLLAKNTYCALCQREALLTCEKKTNKQNKKEREKKSQILGSKQKSLYKDEAMI